MILLMEEILHQLRLVVYPMSFRALYISGGAGFLPSTVPAIVWVFEFYTCSFWKIREDKKQLPKSPFFDVLEWAIPKGKCLERRLKMRWHSILIKKTKRTYTHTLLLFLMSLSMYINNHIHNRCPVFYKHIVLHFNARNCLADLDISHAPFLSRTAPRNVEVKIPVFENCCHAPASWSPPSGISKGIHLVGWFRIGYPPSN